MYALTYRRTYMAAPVRRCRDHAKPHAEHSAEVKNVLDRQRVQTKLNVGSANDHFEQEADRVADQVMATESSLGHPAIAQSADPNVIRRTTVSPFSIEEGRLVSGEEETVQTKKSDNSSPTSADVPPAAKIQSVVQRSGQPLPDSTRTFMEHRFGGDFSIVRIHADHSADEAASILNARAFTKGQAIVFAQGQYSPHSNAGKHLLAHELTHVVQQQGGSSSAYQDGTAAIPEIKRDDHAAMVRRVRWNAATDTGEDSYPWGSGPKGDVYEVQTDGGNTINAWKPHDGTTYWCHGYTFGGSVASGGPFSIWGQDVPQVLSDDGWQHEHSCVAQPQDILVFRRTNVTHSGVVFSAYEPNGIIDERASMLDSKWGQKPQSRVSWLKNAKQYGRYRVYSKNPALGPCADEGANER